MTVKEAYLSFKDGILSFIRSRTGWSDDAEDLMQDVFRNLMLAEEKTEIEDYGAWLYRSAANRIIDASRKKREERLPEGVYDDMTLLLLDERSNPELDLVRSQSQEEFSEALAELPEKERQAFVATALEGKTFRELSEETGIPLNTLLSRKRKATERLRERLKEVYNDLLLLYDET